MFHALPRCLPGIEKGYLKRNDLLPLWHEENAVLRSSKPPPYLKSVVFYGGLEIQGSLLFILYAGDPKVSILHGLLVWKPLCHLLES